MSDVNPKAYTNIPGTPVFSIRQAARGFYLNQFCMSLMKSENRSRFLDNESLYLDEWALSERQKQAILDRDYNAMVELGGNVYFLVKLGATDNKSVLSVVASMTDFCEADYALMMRSGGRSPDGNRYIEEWC